MNSVVFTIRKENPKAKKWYVIACDPGSEKKVIKYIRREKKIRSDETDKKIGRFIIPRHIEKRTSPDGVTKQVRCKSFPGYVIVNMVFDNDVFLLIEDARRAGSIGLLPIRTQFYVKSPDAKKAKKKTNLTESEIEELVEWGPTALDSEEAALIMLRNSEKKTKPKATNIKAGCRIKVTNEKSAYFGQEARVTSVIPTSKGFDFVAEMKLMDRYVSIRISDTDCTTP